ncbi:MAG: GDP-mannose 4,6-dehydratase, partial [Crocinitomicaceae bacterium]|nr:GDP-mannose 4,6-dehydratase [Crocinitomicaceae bacterium]
MSWKKNILVTGGAGFIGSHVVRLLVNKYPDYRIINLDKLTYAGNLNNLIDVPVSDQYVFLKEDICDAPTMKEVFDQYQITDVIHLAAESHVDRSIEGPMEFVLTNIVGTVNLLQCAKDAWSDYSKHVFHHVSTDEVYGSLGEEGLFEETT